jgi:hypothetical protein
LTLGGADDAERLLAKTRRVLIDLNRIIAEEEAHYNRREGRDWPLRAPALITQTAPALARVEAFSAGWKNSTASVGRGAEAAGPEPARGRGRLGSRGVLRGPPACFRQRFRDRLELAEERLALAEERGGQQPAGAWLEQEFQPDSLARRQRCFRSGCTTAPFIPPRCIRSSGARWERAIAAVIAGRGLGALGEPLARELAREYLGLERGHPSRAEGDELLLDLSARIAAEDLLRLRRTSRAHVSVLLGRLGRQQPPVRSGAPPGGHAS